MAWCSDLVPMLRVIINDVDEDNYSYTDARLQELLVTAAQLVIVDIQNLDTTYTVDITEQSITPDPTNPRDDVFINFLVLKAACMTDEGNFRSKALAAGIRARCGPATIDTMQYLAGFRDLMNFGPCKSYETLKYEYMFGHRANVKAVLGPFVSNDYIPPTNNVDSRERYYF